jgi:hypothetical protein
MMIKEQNSKCYDTKKCHYKQWTLQNLTSILLQIHHHFNDSGHQRSSPLAVLYIKSAGKMGTDEPPGTNAFKGRQNSA